MTRYGCRPSRFGYPEFCFFVFVLVAFAVAFVLAFALTVAFVFVFAFAVAVVFVSAFALVPVSARHLQTVSFC